MEKVEAEPDPEHDVLDNKALSDFRIKVFWSCLFLLFENLFFSFLAIPPPSFSPLSIWKRFPYLPYLSFNLFFLFGDSHVRETMQHLNLLIWFISLNIIVKRCILSPVNALNMIHEQFCYRSFTNLNLMNILIVYEMNFPL